MRPRSPAFFSRLRVKSKCLASISSAAGRTSFAANCAAVSAIWRCSSEKSSGVKMSEGWRSSIRKLPPVTALAGAEVVAVAMFEDAPVFWCNGTSYACFVKIGLLLSAEHMPLKTTFRYNCYTLAVRFDFDKGKSSRLRANPKRGIGFEEAQEVFMRPYYLDQRSDIPEQYRAIGWAGDRLYSVIFEVREDGDGEYFHLVTLWKSTRQEQE